MNNKMFFYIALLGFSGSSLLGMKKPDSVENHEMVIFASDKLQEIAKVVYAHKVNPDSEQDARNTIPRMSIAHVRNEIHISLAYEKTFKSPISGILGNVDTHKLYVENILRWKDGVHIVSVIKGSETVQFHVHMTYEVRNEFTPKLESNVTSWKMPESLQKFVAFAYKLTQTYPKGTKAVGGATLLAVAWYFGVVAKITKMISRS